MKKTIRCQNPKCDKDITDKVKVRTVKGEILCQECNVKAS
jgi:hypothetical protein